MSNHFKNKLIYKIWLIGNFDIINDLKKLCMYNLIMVEKYRTFTAPKALDLMNHLSICTDGYPIYINNDGIVFQHLNKIKIKPLKYKLNELYYVTKHYNNIIYNYNIYRNDCCFIIHFIKSYIDDIISFIPYKVIKYDKFHNKIKFTDYIITCI